MKTVFMEELNRGFRSKRFIVAIIFPLLFFILGYWRTFSVPQDNNVSYADLWFMIYIFSYFPYIVPLIAMLPFADSLAEERGEGLFLPMVFVREHAPHWSENSWRMA